MAFAIRLAVTREISIRSTSMGGRSWGKLNPDVVSPRPGRQVADHGGDQLGKRGDRASGLEDAGLDPERDDDEGAEDHRRQHGRLRAVQLHDVQGVELGIGGPEQRRYDREVLGDVVRDGERGQRAPVISSCLPISTTSMSLVGLESRSTMLPASLAAVVPVFMATPTSA